MYAARSFNHLIRPLQERRRDRQAEGLGHLEVDDQLERLSLLDWQITSFRGYLLLGLAVQPEPLPQPANRIVRPAARNS